MFFVVMAAGGKSVSGLAIPGSIITTIGLMLFLQNLTGHWESWAYGWTVILMSVGAGIFIMGALGGQEAQRRSGIQLLKLGGLLFVIFAPTSNSLQFVQAGAACLPGRAGAARRLPAGHALRTVRR
jgi:hypothetical protein